MLPPNGTARSAGSGPEGAARPSRLSYPGDEARCRRSPEFLAAVASSAAAPADCVCSRSAWRHLHCARLLAHHSRRRHTCRATRRAISSAWGFSARLLRPRSHPHDTVYVRVEEASVRRCARSAQPRAVSGNLRGSHAGMLGGCQLLLVAPHSQSANRDPLITRRAVGRPRVLLAVVLASAGPSRPARRRSGRPVKVESAPIRPLPRLRGDQVYLATPWKRQKAGRQAVTAGFSLAVLSSCSSLERVAAGMAIVGADPDGAYRRCRSPHDGRLALATTSNFILNRDPVLLSSARSSH